MTKERQHYDVKGSITDPMDVPPVNSVPTLEPKAKVQPEPEVNKITIAPNTLDWDIVLQEAGIKSDEELLALGDEAILKLLAKMLNRKDFIKEIHNLRQARNKK